MIIAANLKTNLTREKTAKYIKEVESFLNQHNISQEVFVFPAISNLISSSANVVVGAQNAYPTQNGAFTGEIGNEQLEEFGIKTILIGHSERRHVIGETQDSLIVKFNFYKNLGFKIIYCVGEPLHIREMGHEKMMEYISAQYVGIDAAYENLIIAYEPVWAIGTGLTPTLEDIKMIHKELKAKSTAPLLYGGSVKVTNVEEVLALDGVDGVLVGSAALYVEHFCTMCEYAQNIDKKNKKL
ncbi:triosephosphate isomerase [Sulfurimonas denitrificans DSM 1251]|uniref:Triosephosphate isomerase n=1 Tax=Sulfurimonas denitrificans (strain ATCC 33889 / DSM 1251) TaxID=326298 RepID=TPIS_SULDN|nr:triose-phosphate isomerase [Sulfurimonas denitrificans]Q30PQ5.1 RecName: Full=Triosephosphate isomerase; Short=TIM; Short=TPI; AltName: Full=Triose-phosphate isomerase [Sulfurimonas denitrificans DSM 1251]ABB45026.1 triosephosphate isomerase [Sulfurimonas denitrificans DSM 1251]MDD3442216.1 triose-phosphate isomerase [Sulfurimonas denitrificans]